ncbi:MAG: hypothetical protein QOK38_978, partial [Acidobacteriaceae bacterium]|nr:hypothetical protein [Acidobacteriaceae bacterium]
MGSTSGEEKEPAAIPALYSIYLGIGSGAFLLCDLEHRLGIAASSSIIRQREVFPEWP